MATFDLGRVTPLYKGDYSASASYELNDVVLYNGNLYWHVQATATVGILPTDTTVWKLAFADEGVRAEIREYADSAQNSADSALSSKAAAASSASSASASASQAALSAQTAQTAETGATASAQAASTKASEATASAQSAASSAQIATDKATLATNKAQAASESATLATAKANAAATSETNATTAAQTATTKASEAAASATSAQEYDESAQQSAVNAQASATNAAASEAAAKSYAEDSAAYFGAYPTDTAEGEIASFSDGADDIPLKSLVIGIEPVQDLSQGDPSPENICPISGWTGCNVQRTGFNVWDEEWEIGGIISGNNISETDKIRSKNYIPVVSGNTYFIYCKTSVLIFLSYYDSDKNYLSSSNGIRNVAVTIPERCRYIRFRMQTTYGTTYKNDICINLSDTAKNGTYESGHVVTIPFDWQIEAGMVYGGKLDVTNGVLTVTKGFIQSYNGEPLPSTWISDRDVYAQGATPTTGAEVCYDLATPITYQLTPIEVKSLLGQNNIWADTGDTTVEYRANTSAYVAKKIAEAISALS